MQKVSKTDFFSVASESMENCQVTVWSQKKRNCNIFNERCSGIFPVDLKPVTDMWRRQFLVKPGDYNF